MLLARVCRCPSPGCDIVVDDLLDVSRATHGKRMLQTAPVRVDEVVTFEPFAQVDQAVGRSTAGIGVGLTMIQALADLHGGTVKAESDGPSGGADSQ